MKTISVKQVATALDITPRAVIYRLEKKQLRGTQSPNAFGKQEWRVYPTKEIIEGLKRNAASVEKARREASDSGDFDFSPEDIDVVEAETIQDGSSEMGTETTEFDAAPDGEPRDWQYMARETMKSMAEELVKPLGEIIKQQQDRLAEQQDQLVKQDRLIEDKERQLRLLPDLKKQAEEEHKAAELRALEVEALKKQISAIEEENQSLKATVEQMRQPFWKRWFAESNNTKEPKA